MATSLWTHPTCGIPVLGSFFLGPLHIPLVWVEFRCNSEREWGTPSLQSLGFLVLVPLSWMQWTPLLPLSVPISSISYILCPAGTHFFSPQPSRPSPVSRVTQEGRSLSGWAPMETCCHMELEPYSFQFFLVSPSPAAELLDPSRLTCPPLSILRNTMYPAQSWKEEICDPLAMASGGMMSVP